jgi:hypothetical protein
MVLRATAVAPTKRYSARIFQLVQGIYPPEFAIEIEPPNESAPAAASGERLTEIHLDAHIDRLPGIRSFIVYSAEGPHVVHVHKVAPIQGGTKGSEEILRATGYSDGFSFDEAFRNALAQMPSVGHFNHFKVVEIGATYGFFPFPQRMYVTIERGSP